MLDEMNRRSFLAAAAAATCACALCPMVRADDDDDDAPPEKLPPGPQSVGKTTDYANDGPYDALSKSKQIVLVRENGKLYAMSSLCTHKYFAVKVKDNEFCCPKHNSRFDYTGKPVPRPTGKMGPAKKPLAHFAISVDASGAITVDTSKVVAQSDPSASIKL